MSLKKEKEKKETSGMAITKLIFALINHILKIKSHIQTQQTRQKAYVGQCHLASPLLCLSSLNLKLPPLLPIKKRTQKYRENSNRPITQKQ